MSNVYILFIYADIIQYRCDGTLQNKLLLMKEKLLLKKRNLVKSVFNVFNNVFEIEHTRHRSAANALVHILSTLVAYSFKQTKPSMKMV